MKIVLLSSLKMKLLLFLTVSLLYIPYDHSVNKLCYESWKYNLISSYSYVFLNLEVFWNQNLVGRQEQKVRFYFQCG